MMDTTTLGPWLVMLCVGAACGCGSDEEASKDSANVPKESVSLSKQRVRTGSASRNALAIKTYDLNQDGKPDQWILSDEGKLVRIERDLNFDGRIDQWQYPDGAGEIVEEEMDLDRDGKIDVVTFYSKGIVSRKELALDFTGKFTIAKIYNNRGTLLRIERDEDADGVTDVWEYYEGGRRVRIGWDENKDGAPDRFDTMQ